MGEISVKTGNNARNGGKNSLNRLIRCVCGKKIGPDPRNFNQRVSLGRNDLLIRTFPNIDLYSADSDKHLLEGLCKGLASDYHLSDEEISYLNWFLSTNAALKSNYPGKHLYELVQSILSDGVITDEERTKLLQEITAFTDSNISEGIVDGYSTTSPVDLIDEFNPTDSKVCLTGKFLCGSRRQCESDLLKLGCQIVDRVTQDLDYLIIGALSSKDWKFQSFGRKIEQAIDYRDNKGVPLKILSEEHWQTLMRDNNSISQ
ncbi:BRCT domain-containing protein [Enterobacter hormaechei]|uniref:BRCT domain-containing protein n=2 Tax=Enterobacteriaceae TaxID=543 RepID=UPI00388D17CD